MSPDPAALADIAIAARRLAQFVESLDEEAFLASELTQSAAMYQLAVIGEAVKRLSPEFRSEHGEIAWSEVAGLRDILIHAYHRVSLVEVWAIVTRDVPILLSFVEPLLPDAAIE